MSLVPLYCKVRREITKVMKTKDKVTEDAEAVAVNMVNGVVKVVDAEVVTKIDGRTLFAITAAAPDISPDIVNVQEGATKVM